MKTKLLLIAIIAASAAAAVIALVYVGIPFDSRPFGTHAAKVADRFWLAYDTTFEDPGVWIWELVYTKPNVQGPIWFDGSVAGSVVATHVQGYAVPQPGLIVVRTSKPDGNNLWSEIRLSEDGFADKKDFTSENELRGQLHQSGVAASLVMQTVPSPSRFQTGTVSGAIIVACVAVALIALMRLRKTNTDGDQKWGIKTAVHLG
jgi:hypothetical protein